MQVGRLRQAYAAEGEYHLPASMSASPMPESINSCGDCMAPADRITSPPTST